MAEHLEAYFVINEEGEKIIEKNCYLIFVENTVHSIPVDAVEKGQEFYSFEDGRTVRLRTSDEENKEKMDWDDAKTKLLLHLYKEKKNLVEERKIKTLKKMWNLISDRMKGYGYIASPLQIENKWKSLERGYKNKILISKKTGRGRISCPYERELEDILSKRHSIQPICTLGSSTMGNVVDIKGKKRKQDCTIEECIEDEQIAGPSNVSVPEAERCFSPTIQEPSINLTEQVVIQEKTEHQNIISVPSQKRNRDRTTTSELSKIRQLQEEMFKFKKQNEERKFKQRQEFINELKTRNELLTQLLNKKQ